MSTTVLNQGPPNGVSVLVVGAGVGGLMTAMECARIGCSVRVLERTKASSALEMQRENEHIRRDPLTKFCDRYGVCQRGPFSMTELMADSSVSDGRRVWRYLRPQMHAMLHSQLSRMGVTISYDHPVESYFDEAEGGLGGVVLRDGSRLTADLVIAADGVRGNSWPLVAGRPVPARSSGDAMLRVAYPVELALADPVVAERFPLHEDGNSILEVWADPDWMFFIWRAEDRMSWILSRPDNGTAEESWSSRVEVEDVLKLTATIPGWPEVGDRLIRTTPKGELVDWKLMWRDPQPTWTSPAGRVLQLGDAAHTFLPSSGNGGTQAIEDAVSLAACLSVAAGEGPLREQIPRATRVHNLLRFERVSCLQAFGVQNKKIMSQKGAKSGPHLGRWILDHDPEKYALENYHKALAHLEKGEPFQNTNTPPGLVYRPWTIEGILQAHENGEPTILDGDWE